MDGNEGSFQEFKKIIKDSACPAEPRIPMIFSLLIVSLFIASLAITFAVSIWEPASAMLSALISAGLITVAFLPATYFFYYRQIKASTVSCNKRSSDIRLAYNVLESSSEPILITDAQARIEYVNPAFCAITGYAETEVIGKNPSMMQSGRHNREFFSDMWTSLRESGKWQGEIWDKRKNGEIYPKWLSINAVKDDTGQTLKYVGVFSDITSLKQTEAHLEYLAHYDSLTNIPNRLLFRDRLKQAMRRADRSKRMVAVMMLDLNRFKHINDSLGHLAGDQLLQDFSRRMAECLRKEDTVSRLGGDEFAVILDDISNEADAEIVAHKIFAAIATPFILKDSNEVYATTSIGITLYPKDGDKLDLLMRNADMAMYLAKEQGENVLRFYDPSIGNRSFEILSMETNLRKAIEREEFVLHYQPQVDLRTGVIIGMEALIRRQEADWIIPPGRFIPLAEDTGLIVPICEWTLRTACRQNQEWRSLGLPPLRVAINLTATQLFSVKLLQTVEKILSDTGLDPKLLELELTERVIVRDSQMAIQLMKDLKAMGICLSIDDFGTGYSSLSYLKRFPIDKLKVDQSFVRDCTRDEGSAAITRAIISLGHNLSLRVIAEGIETEDQLRFVSNEGCDEIQGYFFSVPLAPEKFKTFIESGKKLAV